MELIKKLYNPFIRSRVSTSKVMADVIFALLPCAVITWFAYGFYPVMVILVAAGSALVAEYLFSAVFLKNTRSIADGSAIVTAILLAFTIGPFTPLYVVAFGGAAAVIFGKMLWGGLGRNRFNPALIGREFMVIFFPAIMNSGKIWSDSARLNYESLTLFENEFLDGIFFHPGGAIGEYSPILLALGGLFLLLRKRISWHTPLAMLGTFTVLLFIFRGSGINFSLGGLILGAVYMATDMPTGTSTNAGKLYFGAMTAVVGIICLLNGVDDGYSSYMILLMNGFVVPLNWIFRTRVWGRKTEIPQRLLQGAIVTIAIILTTYLVIWIHKAELLMYPVFLYIVYTIIRFTLGRRRRDTADTTTEVA